MSLYRSTLRRPVWITLAAIVVTLASAPAQALIDEITVTARKKEESLKDVPLSITAFNADMIEAAGITSLSDVAELTPGLSFFNPFGEDLPVPIIRGVAQTDIFGETNAAIFIDGVYVAGREGLNFSQLDVETIEVVKGPQSSLFGRTAFSGAIIYTTKRPSEEFEARGEATAGNRDKQKGSLLVSGPLLGQKLRGRASMLYDDWDGSYNNSENPGVDIGGYRFRSYQGSLVWEPLDNLEIYANVYHSNDEIDDPALVGIAASCENRLDEDTSDVRFNNFCGQVPELDQVPKPAPGLIDSNSLPKIARALGADRDLLRGTLNVELDLAFGSVTFLTGYSDLEQSSLSDFGHLGDNIPFLYCSGAAIEPPGSPNSCGPNPANQRFLTGVLDEEFGSTVEEFSQEIRFTSDQDKPFRFSVGGYAYESTLESFDGGTIATGPLPAADIGLAPFDAASAPNFAIGTAIFYCTFTPDGCLDPLVRPRLEETSRSWATFGSAEYDITERLTVRGELRYTQTRKEAEVFEYTECIGIGQDPGCIDDFYDLRVPGALPPNPASPTDGSASGAERFSSVTGRINLKFLLNDNWQVYGNIATGDKPGGIDVRIEPDIFGTEELIVNTWETEEITAYELGLKGRTQDARIGLDLGLYYYDWTAIVLRQIIEESPNTGIPFEQPEAFNFNAGDARVWGWEISTDVAFTDNLDGRITVNWNEAELTNARQDTFETFPTLAPDGAVDRNRLLRQPEWMGSASLSYERSLWREWEWSARVDATYQGKVFVGNDNQSWIPGRTYVNMNLGISSGRYSVNLWARNLFNDDSAIAAFRDIYWSNAGGAITPPFADLGPRPSFDKFVPLRYSVTYPPLRTFGITAKVRFGAARN